MEHVNDDMDDLYKKAGENYPLKISEPDWDAVWGKLKQDVPGATGEPASPSKKVRSKRRRFLLLLLIPIVAGSIVYFFPGDKKSALAPGASGAENKPVPSMTEMNATPNNKSAGSANANNANQANANFEGSANKNSGNRANASTGGNTNTLSAGRNMSYSSTGIVSGNTKKTTGATDEVPVTAKNKNVIPVASAAMTENDEANATKDKTDSSATAKTDSLKVVASDVLTPVSPETKSSAVRQSPTAKPVRGFYAGILAGPEFSSIKLQCIKPPGISFGIIAGYRINRHLAAESGLFWSKLNYYSKGEYFNTAKTNIMPGHNILSIEGDCNMYEIPLALRYDFVSKNSDSYFIKGGVSSYLMKKESYDYTAEFSGNTYPGKRTYANAGNNIFSIIELSAGYERAISHSTMIRIEPYVKIPLAGVGIGSMPISSAGIYLGIIHLLR